MLRVAVLLLVSGCELVFPLAKHKAIEIDQPSPTTLVNFPVSITIEDEAVGEARSDGSDIRFVDEDGTVLVHELAFHDPENVSGGQAPSFNAWVLIPELPPEPITIEVLWGDGRDGPDAPLDVWSEEFLGVWHMSESDGARDSTRNDRRFVAVQQPDQTSGIAGPAGLFTVDDQLCLPTAVDLAFDNSSFSVSMWVQVARHVGMFDRPFDKGGGSDLIAGTDVELGIDEWRAHVSDGMRNNTTADGNIEESVGVTLFEPGPLNQWVHLAWTVERDSTTTGTLRGYANGSKVDEAVFASMLSLAQPEPTCLGKPGDLDDEFEGRLDEIVVAGTTLSDAWMFAHYENLSGSMITILE